VAAGAALTAVLGVAVMLGGWQAMAAPDHRRVLAPTTADGRSVAAAAPQPSIVARPRAATAIAYPTKGKETWRFAAGNSAVAGESGQLLHYRVAVEGGIAGVSANEFGSAVASTLADPRSWTAGGRWRLQRVGPGRPYHFTVYLATPVTRDRLCAMGRDRYTSCRNGNHVVINVARWVHGVPHYGAPLATYRQYVVNHEVGHRLDHGHEPCPGKGRPAPVMQQQTLGLRGCVANAWPFN
jgi:hypothetical protein